MTNAKDRLKEQIRAIRAKLDPRVLRWAERELTGAETYDKDAAREAIDLFLKGRTGDTDFMLKLKARMRQEGGDAPAKPKPKTPPTKGS